MGAHGVWGERRNRQLLEVQRSRVTGGKTKDKALSEMFTFQRCHGCVTSEERLSDLCFWVFWGLFVPFALCL